MNDQPQISYLITVYNKADVVLETLDNLRGQIGLMDDQVEFIFIDDNSSDNSVELLQKQAEQDDRITVVASSDNLGPSVRVNQAAKMAKGEYLLPVDADDLLPMNASKYFLDMATEHDVPLIFGRSMRWRQQDDCKNIDLKTQITMLDDPLAFCAKKQIVHMGFFVTKKLWQKAGGADEQVFIQDQSLPLRLCAAASNMAYVDDVVYWLRPADDTNMSVNVMQQHHDRYLALYPLIVGNIGTPKAQKALQRQMVSTVWKAKRDGGRVLPQLSYEFMFYLLNRTIGVELSVKAMQRIKDSMCELPNIRRSGELS